jgi:diguanylate cyclase
MYSIVFIVASICVCICFGVAKLIERRFRSHDTDSDGALQTSAQATQTEETANELNSDVEAELVQELLKSLQDLTQEVRDDVDRHSSRVAKITESHDLDSVSDPATVLKAAKLLVEANKELQHDLTTAKEEIRVQKQQTLSYMDQAHTDELTGLSNRRVFERELRHRCAQWERQGIPLSLILLDVDQFKRFNDYHGHQTGDIVLKAVAEVLEKSIREMDIVCRYGGEEFGVILPGITLNEGQFFAERIRKAVANNTITVDGSELRVTISAGLAQALEDEQPKALVNRADKALYAAKNSGRNLVGVYDGLTIRFANADSLCLGVGS